LETTGGLKVSNNSSNRGKKERLILVLVLVLVLVLGLEP
jgi:hypothetical protein